MKERNLRLAMSLRPRILWRWMDTVAGRRRRTAARRLPMQLVQLASCTAPSRPAPTGRTPSWTLNRRVTLHLHPRFTWYLGTALRHRDMTRMRVGPGVDRRIAALRTERASMPRLGSAATGAIFVQRIAAATVGSGHPGRVIRPGERPPGRLAPLSSGTPPASSARLAGFASHPSQHSSAPPRAAWPLTLPVTATGASRVSVLTSLTGVGWWTPPMVLAPIFRSMASAVSRNEASWRSADGSATLRALPAIEPGPSATASSRPRVTADWQPPRSLTYAQPQGPGARSAAAPLAAASGAGAAHAAPAAPIETRAAAAIDLRRLTDEVYGKLEERLRIEKERRGF